MGAAGTPAALEATALSQGMPSLFESRRQGRSSSAGAGRPELVGTRPRGWGLFWRDLGLERAGRGGAREGAHARTISRR